MTTKTVSVDLHVKTMSGKELTEWADKSGVDVAFLVIGAMKVGIEPLFNTQVRYVGGKFASDDKSEPKIETCHQVDEAKTVMCFVPTIFYLDPKDGKTILKEETVQVFYPFKTTCAFGEVTMENLGSFAMKLAGDLHVGTSVRAPTDHDKKTLVGKAEKAYEFFVRVHYHLEDLDMYLPYITRPDIYDSIGVLLDGKYATVVYYPKISEFGVMSVNRAMHVIIDNVPDVMTYIASQTPSSFSGSAASFDAAAIAAAAASPPPLVLPPSALPPPSQSLPQPAFHPGSRHQRKSRPSKHRA